MKILNQLNDEQLTELLLESDEKDLRRHISDLPEFSRTSTEHDENFWRQQRISITAKIAAQRKGGVFGLLPLLAGAAAVIVLAFTMLSSTHHRPTPVAHVQAQAALNDHDLLLQVEASTESNGPEALQPAALLADEIGQNTTGSASTGHIKEKSTNEN
jgi:hypothetical protein